MSPIATAQADRYLIRFGIVVPYGDGRDELDVDVVRALDSWTARAPFGYRTAPDSQPLPAGMVRHQWRSGQRMLPPLTVTAARTSVSRSCSSVALTIGYTPPGARAGRLADAAGLRALLVKTLERRVRRLAEGLDGVVTLSPNRGGGR